MEKEMSVEEWKNLLVKENFVGEDDEDMDIALVIIGSWTQGAKSKEITKWSKLPQSFVEKILIKLKKGGCVDLKTGMNNVDDNFDENSGIELALWINIAKGFLKKVRIEECQKCGYRWEPRLEHPRICPKCKSARWDDVFQSVNQLKK